MASWGFESPGRAYQGGVTGDLFPLTVGAQSTLSYKFTLANGCVTSLFFLTGRTWACATGSPKCTRACSRESLLIGYPTVHEVKLVHLPLLPSTVVGL